MTSVSSLPGALPGAALQASRAALASALAENGEKVVYPDDSHQEEREEPGVDAQTAEAKAEAKADADADMEEGEIQEVDMEAQAEGLKTVFNDPRNFDVKVRPESSTS